MQYSKNGLQLTEQFEGVSLTAYQDVRGVWTIGYGHTGPDVVEGMIITQDQADDLLLGDIQTAVNAVSRLVKVSLSQSEFDALVDFVFNVGQSNFANSTMLRSHNSGDYDGAAAQFDRWSYAGGHQIAGLLRRRQAETAEFQSGESQQSA